MKAVTRFIKLTYRKFMAKIFRNVQKIIKFYFKARESQKNLVY